jgi:hypothetical protein
MWIGNLLEEDLMVNHFQASLLTAERIGKGDQPIRLAFIQAALGFALVLMISVFGLFATSHAIGQDASGAAAKGPSVVANVLPPLVISPESLEPNLNGTLATGDGGSMIETKETTGGLLQASTRR